jgi:DNA (cytosine-5)-methyltransferase 1
VLAEHWPGVPIYDDVRAVGEPAGRTPADGHSAPTDGGRREAGSGLPGVDLLCGGFPCQDLSVAGQRKGLAGERSGLFFEFARVIDAFRPGWLLVENVPGLLSSNGGRDFGVVLGTLADLGYGLAWRILDSRFFGVPQRRRRVFIVGTVADNDPRAAAERAGQVLAVGTRCPRHSQAGGEAGSESARTLTGGSGGGRYDKQPLHYYVEDHEDGPLRANGAGGPPRTDKQPLVVTSDADAQRERHEGDAPLVVAGAGASTPAVAAPAGIGIAQQASVRRLTPTECERLQALPDGWTNHGPDSRRYAALGDAVTSSVAYWIGSRLMQSAGGSRAGRTTA